jgi:hypothetical protein
MALGYIAGEILHIGPNYHFLVGSSSAVQDWTSCWTDYYQKEVDLELLRRMNEQYTANILEYVETDLARISPIQSPYVTAWRHGEPRPHSMHPDASPFQDDSPIKTSPEDRNKPPRICLGTGQVMGLVPPTSRIGDVIVRFWGCNSAIVMRPLTGPLTAGSFMLVGRADVAAVLNQTDEAPSKLNSSVWDKGAFEGFRADSKLGGAVNVELDLRTLQKITAHVAY